MAVFFSNQTGTLKVTMQNPSPIDIAVSYQATLTDPLGALPPTSTVMSSGTVPALSSLSVNFLFSFGGLGGYYIPSVQVWDANRNLLAQAQFDSIYVIYTP